MIYEEYSQAQRTLDLCKSLPVVRIPDELTRPLGHGELKPNDLDFEMMINMRRQHQTKHAASGVRTKKVKVSDNTTMRSHICENSTKHLKRCRMIIAQAQELNGWLVGQVRIENQHQEVVVVLLTVTKPQTFWQAMQAMQQRLPPPLLTRLVNSSYSQYSFNDCSYSHIFRQINDAKTFF